jgi:hypothetical protein
VGALPARSFQVQVHHHPSSLLHFSGWRRRSIANCLPATVLQEDENWPRVYEGNRAQSI